VELDLQTRYQAARTFLFEGMDEFVVEHILSDNRCILEEFPRGAVIHEEEHFHRSLGLILSGRVRIERRTDQGRPVLMQHLGPGDCLGASSVFLEETLLAAVITVRQPVRLLVLPQEMLRWIMARNYPVAENYIRYLSTRIGALGERIVSLTAGSAAKRLAWFLLEEIEDQDSQAVSMTDLGRQLNMGRASVYRAMEELEQAGALIREGKSIRIMDRELLRQLGESADG